MTQPAGPTDREMMEMAIDQMRQSVPEPDKSNPLVGAAIRWQDGTVEGAHRAQLRDGEHAEHSLLDHLLLGRDLTGAHLFVTLEPCGPGSRTPPEKPCALRIAEARISEVWVGINDPHRKVNGKGITYLETRSRPIAVHQFDDDLQTVIRDENAEWLAAAIEDAAREKAGLTGDLFEHVFPRATIAHLSTPALNFYRAQAHIRPRANSPEFRQHLYEIGVLDSPGADAHLTGLGVILFATEPQQFVAQAGLNAIIHLADGREIIPNPGFNSPAILIPDLLEDWLKATFPDVDSRDQMVRKKIPQLPFKAIREAVINALVHRDYMSGDASRAFVQVSISDDAIVVRSPGGPVPPISLEDMNGLHAAVYMRNTALTYYLVKGEIMERQNLGMKTFRGLAEGGYPPPVYSFEAGYLTMTMYRTFAAAAVALTGGVVLKGSLEPGWEFIVSQGSAQAMTPAKYAEHMGFDAATARRHLGHFVTLGWLVREGAGRATAYRMVRRQDAQ